MINSDYNKIILEKFLSCDLASPKEVFGEFRKLNNAQYFPEADGNDDFIYIPGKRSDRIVLVVHADTVFAKSGQHKVLFENGIYSSGEYDVGIGADDRAGCAMLYLLKDSGHSLLITNSEELGCLGSRSIRENHCEIFDELNNHMYFLELDRRNSQDFKTYHLPVSKEFKRFIAQETGFKEAEPKSSTDITILCDKICGVNLSVGYYYEHTRNEILVYNHWKHSLDVVTKLLEKPQKKFPLEYDRQLMLNF